MREYLEACKIVSTHGVRGEMKAALYCDGIGFLRQVKTLYWDDQGRQPVAVTGVRAQGNLALLCLEGVQDLDAARAKMGKLLYVAHDEVPLPEGSYFIEDVVGCRVVDADTGKEYGRVKSITHPGAQDVYTVVDDAGGEYLFPGVPEFLKQIDLQAGVVRVSPIPGMFEDAVNGDAD